MTRAEDRYDAYLDELFERRVEAVCDDYEKRLDLELAESGGLKEYQKVSPEAREKLKGILKHYSRQAHPWRTCVRDQIKHGLPEDLAKKRCSVIKDLIRNTTAWRGEHKSAPKIGGGMMHFMDRLDDADLGELITIAEQVHKD